MAKRNEEFLTQVLRGQRFGEAELPVEVLPDITTFQELVIKIAKELYAIEHGGVQAPKAFAERFQLRLRDITPGSTVSHLVRVNDDSLPVALIDQSRTEDEFTRARDLIYECIDHVAKTNTLPESLPRAAYSLFGKFGRRLQKGDTIELKLPSSDAPRSVVYSPDLRKRLALLTGGIYEEEFDVVGKVTGVDVHPKRVFKLSVPEKGTFTVPFPPLLQSAITNALRDHRFVQVGVVGLGKFDLDDRLKDFVGAPEIEFLQQVDSATIREIETRLRSFEDLSPGWLDGEGEAPSPEGLGWVRGVLLGAMAANRWAVPRLFPTPEGGVQAEWTVGAWAVSATFDLEARTASLYASNVETRSSREAFVNFADEGSETDLSSFIDEFVAVAELT